MIEKVCDECGKPFETIDEEMKFCQECWQKKVDLTDEGKGIANS